MAPIKKIIIVNLKDFKYDVVGDISNVLEGDICPKCGGNLFFKKGIEIGNLFKLGTKYAKALDLTYLDQNNQEQVVTMGSYGIGIGRILASIVEQNNDDNGMILPTNIAPFEVGIVVIDSKNKEQMALSENIYQELKNNGIDVVLDDRNERPGIKFKDLDLIGIPLRITVGRKAVDNIVEIKERISDDILELNIAGVLEYVQKYLNKTKK